MMLVSIGDEVRPGSYRVHSRFRRVVNLMRGRDMVSLVTTAVGAGPGTPAYMAPERFSSGHASDGSADIYSLGVMLYSMLVGRLPFFVTGGNLIKLAMKHQASVSRKLESLYMTKSLANCLYLK